MRLVRTATVQGRPVPKPSATLPARYENQLVATKILVVDDLPQRWELIVARARA